MPIIQSKDLNDITEEFQKRITRLANIHDAPAGIYSGIKQLDSITKGFQASSLTIIGGVMGMGKTSFSIALVKKMALENKHSTLFFSVKSTSEQFLMKILWQQTNIEPEKLQTGLLNEEENQRIHTAMEQLKKAPLEICDHPFLTVDAIEEVIAFRPPDSQPEIIVIDSLQLLAKNKKDKVGKILNKQELCQMTYQLKELAEKYLTPIILTTEIKPCQIKTWNKRPRLIDVKKYAPIANYADLVLLLYRPEYYKIFEWDDDDDNSTDGEAEIIIAKNVYGICDTIRIKFKIFKSEIDNLE